MHGARYTSGTELYLATGDIYPTKQLLGHADVSTTVNIYVQGSSADLEGKSSARSGAIELRTIPIDALWAQSFDRKSAVSGDHGGGGNRTRVTFPPPSVAQP